MKLNKIIIVGIVLVASFSSCTKRLDNLLDDPNNPSPGTADVDLYLNAVQLNFNSFWSGANDYGAQLSRQQLMFGPLYRNAYQPATFDGIWTTAYTGVIKNADALIPLAQTQKKYMASGIAKVLKAYTYGTLVDFFGDVPFSEANLGSENTNPKVDPGKDIYTAVIALLTDAITDFGKTSSAKPANDLFYGGSTAKWITLAKTLKFKFLMQERLVVDVKASVQALLTENDLINTEAQDFTFKYGTNVTAPDTRHPHYAINYVHSGGVNDYLSNYFMWMVGAQKWNGSVNIDNTANDATDGDPRMRYYFYRQVLNSANANSETLPCSVNLANPPTWYPSVPDETPFCYIGRGYWGRDHGDNSGAPPDGNYKTTWGIYPVGGKYDNNDGAVVDIGAGGGGKGINPIWLSSFTNFLKAEAALPAPAGLGLSGDPKALMASGVAASIDKVTGFPAAIGQSPSVNSNLSTQIDNYEALVGTLYDNATSDDQRLDLVMSEYHIALWGNGIEPYNNLRRTGKPANVQPDVWTTPANVGYFIRSFFYPSVFVDRNSNAPAQKTPGDAVNKVFWDNHPDNFIK